MQISLRPSAGVDALYAPRRYLLDRILVDAAVDAGAEVLHETRGRGPAPRRHRPRHRRGDRRQRRATREHHGRPGHRRGRHRVRRGPRRRRGTLRQGDWAGAVQYAYFSGVEAAGYHWAYGERRGAPGSSRRTTGRSSASSPRHRRGCVPSGPGGRRPRCSTTSGGWPHPGWPTGSTAPNARRAMHGWGGIPGFVRQSSGPGWALIGDAAYFKDPITAHGITDGAARRRAARDGGGGGDLRRSVRAGGDGRLRRDPRPVVRGAVPGDRRDRDLRLGHRRGAQPDAAGVRRDDRRGRVPRVAARPGRAACTAVQR